MLRLLLACLWLGCFLAAAGRADDGPDRAPKLAPISVEGVVVQVEQQGLVIRTDDGDDYAASVAAKRVYKKSTYADIPAPQVSVTGPGTPGHVVAGVFVDFEMDLGPRRETRFIIPSLKIFTPTNESLLGCFPRRADGGVADQPTPFAQVGEGRWRIVGRIAALKGNDVAVAVPGGAISGKIANTPLVTLEVADHRFARPGDRVVLQGSSPEMPHVFATHLTVTRTDRPSRIPPPRQGEAVAAAADNGEKPLDVPVVLPPEPVAADQPGSYPLPGGEPPQPPPQAESPPSVEAEPVAWEDRWQADKHTWTDKTGQYAIEAVYDGYLGKGKIRLLRKDKSEVVVDLSKLSEPDRRRALELGKTNKD